MAIKCCLFTYGPMGQWMSWTMVNGDKEGLTLRVRRKYDGFGSNKGLVKRWWLDYITTKGCQRSHKRMMSYMNRPLCLMLCNLFTVCVPSSAACPDHGTARTHDSPPPSLQSGWLMNGDLPKTFQLYLSLSLMMKGNETFKVYIHHFVLGLHTFYTNYNVTFLVEVMQSSQLAIFPCLLKWSVGCVHFLRVIPPRQL